MANALAIHALTGNLINRIYEKQVTSSNPGAGDFFNSGINPPLTPLAREKNWIAEKVRNKSLMRQEIILLSKVLYHMYQVLYHHIGRRSITPMLYYPPGINTGRVL